MSTITVATPLVMEKFSSDFTREYVRASGYLPYLGKGEGSIIHVKNDLMGKGSIVHVPALARLKGAGVTGGSTLVGNEEALAQNSVKVITTLRRNAVALTEDQKCLTEIDLLNAAKPALRDWAAESLRDDITAQLQGIPVANGGTLEDTIKSYAVASAAERNSFCTNNADRVLFGVLKSNNTGTMSTSLLNVDSAADKMSAAMVVLAKSMARKAGVSNRRITPFKTADGREYYVLFVDSNGFRDLNNDTTIINANVNARPRDTESNPLFQDGDLLYRGVIIREIPEMGVIAGAGAAGIDVGMASLCGQGAVSLAWTMQPTFTSDTTDYGHKQGVGIKEYRGQAKTSYAGVQQLVNIFHASVADA